MPHEERNDALARGNKIAIQRYKFAIRCLGKSKLVLDIGCGMGYGCQMLRDAGHKVTGVDYSKEAIDYAIENYPGNYLVMDATEVNGDGFDAVVCLETLCHLKEPQRLIDGLRVREGVFSAPVDPSPNDGYFYRLHNLSEQQFKDMFCGWKIIKELRQKNYLIIHAIKNEQDTIL